MEIRYLFGPPWLNLIKCERDRLNYANRNDFFVSVVDFKDFLCQQFSLFVSLLISLHEENTFSISYLLPF